MTFKVVPSRGFGRRIKFLTFLEMLHEFSIGESEKGRKYIEIIARTLPLNTARLIKKDPHRHKYFFPFRKLSTKDVERLLQAPEETTINYKKSSHGPYISLSEYTKHEPDPQSLAVEVDIISKEVLGIYNIHGKELKLDTAGHALIIHKENIPMHIGSCLAINLHRDRIEGIAGKVYLFENPESLYTYFNYKKHILALRIKNREMAELLARKRRITSQVIDKWHDRRLSIKLDY